MMEVREMTEQVSHETLGRYAVNIRYGVVHYYSNRRAAERAARDERKDGWPSHVRDTWAE